MTTGTTTSEDPIRGNSAPDRYWSTANIGEAAPDVMTPLCWSLWGPGNELAVRTTWHRFGLLGPDEVTIDPDQSRRLTGVFFGRQAMNIDVIRPYIDRFPGIAADEFEFGLAGSIRNDAPSFVELTPEQREVVASAVDRVAETHAERLTAMIQEQTRWWLEEVFARNETGDTLNRLDDAFRRFVWAIGLHNETRLLSTAVLSNVYRLATSAEQMDKVPAVFAAFGNVAELDLAADIWALSTGELEQTEFLRKHGYHGKSEGNPAGVSWREQPQLLEGVTKAIATRAGGDHPTARASRAVEARQAAVEQLAQSLTAEQRVELDAALAVAGPSVREIELGKAAFLQAIDGFRAAARDRGDELVATGHLEDRDDVFFLTLDELGTEGDQDIAKTVFDRRERWLEYGSYVLPQTFTGMPVPLTAERARAAEGDVILGVGASAGTHEGRVRVVTRSDDDDDLEPGDVLVCASTDPSWTPTFLLVDAVVIDIGGVASHGAIVARELGLPAVINTGDGSSRLRNGDLVRVDGAAGTVTVLATADVEQ